MENALDNPEKERRYLLELLFELTIVFRDQQITTAGENRMEALKQINEINHRVLNRIRDIEAGEKWTSRESTGQRILSHLDKAPNLKPMFKWASERALESIT